MMATNWKGTSEEALALLEATKASPCGCQTKFDHGQGVAYTAPCTFHYSLAFDQRAVDYLLYGRRMRAHFFAEEWGLEGKPIHLRDPKMSVHTLLEVSLESSQEVWPWTPGKSR